MWFMRITKSLALWPWGPTTSPLMARMSFVGWSCPGSILYCCKDGAAWMGGGKCRLQMWVTVAVRIVSICGGPKALMSLQPSSMRNGSISELRGELPETPGGKITHLPSQKAEAVVFGLPPAPSLHVFSSNIDLVLSASWVLLLP